MVRFFFVVLVGLGFAASCCAMGTPIPRNAHWSPYHFDGNEFRAGVAPSGAATLYLRDGYLPQERIPQAGEEAPLPPNQGALAILCYIQSAGGKQASAAGIVPLRNAPVELLKGATKLTMATDAAGLSLAAIEPGLYVVRVAGQTKTVRVAKGTTTTVAIRAGKRMVD